MPRSAKLDALAAALRERYPEGITAVELARVCASGESLLAVVEPPPKPKRGPTAYVLFSRDRRPRLKAERADLDARSLSRELGRLWRELPETGEDSRSAFRLRASPPPVVAPLRASPPVAAPPVAPAALFPGLDELVSR